MTYVGCDDYDSLLVEIRFTPKSGFMVLHFASPVCLVIISFHLFYPSLLEINNVNVKSIP